MIDLSNNNGVQHDFARAYQSGQRRVYLKASEAIGFRDPDAGLLAQNARKAGFKVGFYHFAHCEHSPLEEANHYLESLPIGHFQLAPCLDLEYQSGSAAKGRWAAEWIAIVQAALNAHCLLYSYGSYLEACRFTRAPAPLWLASYGRNDGHEHPYRVPKPWKVAAAHQFASTALVPGIRGRVDLSHVYQPELIDRRPIITPRRPAVHR